MKKILSLCITLLLFLGMLPCTSVFASENASSTKTTEEVENVLTNYFDNLLSIKKDLCVSENDAILPNSSLDEYNKLLSETTVRWFEGVDQQLDWYNLSTKINSLKNENNLVKVDVDLTVNCQYKDTDSDSGYTDNHILYLKQVDDKLYVEKDIFEIDMKAKDVEKNIKSIGGYDKYISKKINEQKTKHKTLNKDLKARTLEEQNYIAYRSSGSYNRKAASKWALSNVYSSEDYSGQDCTNFVSKALNAGGIPKSSTWCPGSNAWIRVIDLRSYLINNDIATQYSNSNTSQLGDVIQLYNKKGVWSHSVMVTMKSGDNIYVSAHSNAYWNRAFDEYYPSSTYSKCRVLHITY
ncbi:hypothetical protein FDC58_18240 [Clostridium botulinum]|uniref:amidase domain-containing protein n=1 Tax=Clostridium sp. ZBS14 TaxID=2949970 RepID=UPI0013F9A6D2|nr:amidase domain-containing protein [Clostridium sp. ZBS14]NFK98207.1 hypothetical protein [Clostridium botulinum]NFO89536.1 hypothetical protein [Clostridium botulinum]NFP31125.1 hypothetical protein [Clostridium botulinum]